MNSRIVVPIALRMMPSMVRAYIGKIAGPLSCGIYEEMIKPFIQAELDTQHLDQERYTIETTAKNGKGRRSI
jgi:hypothetical protein